MAQGKCRDCAAAEEDARNGDDVFRCHLDPPTGGGFPTVRGVDWCRQFIPRPASSAAKVDATNQGHSDVMRGGKVKRVETKNG